MNPEYAVFNADNEVVSAWFNTLNEAEKRIKFSEGGTTAGEVCPRHDEAGKANCKYCAARGWK